MAFTYKCYIEFIKNMPKWIPGKDINGNIKWAAYDNTADVEFHVGLEVEFN